MIYKLAALLLILFFILACGSTANTPTTTDPAMIQTLIIETTIAQFTLDAPTTIPSQVFSVGKWQTEIETSSFDDSKIVVLTLVAENEIQAWLETTRPVLALRCKEQKFEIYVNTGTSFDVESGVDDAATVRLRFDKAEAETWHLNQSTDGKAVFFHEQQYILDQILTHDTMIFGFTPFNAPPVETSFDLRGIREAIKPLAEACS